MIEAIRKAVTGASLTQEEARDAAEQIMRGEATDAQVAALLTALRMKGETVAEVVGFAQALRANVMPVAAKRAPLLDTCGTGGSAFRVFNVSTAAAFVAAAAGIAVAKHGNRSVSGVCGSADVLEALGVRIDRTPAQVADCIDAVGIGFLFAAKHHPAMKYAAAPRREIGVRTIFNLVGPLTNPAGASLQVMGVYESHLCELAAGALRELGSERAFVFHGEIGLDEIATIGPTRVCELRGGKITDFTLTRRDFGLPEAEPEAEDLAPAATPAENAALLLSVLDPNSANDRATRARREIVAVNAAAALVVSGQAGDWRDGMAQAATLLASGAALQKLDALIAFTAKTARE